ncbi:MAG TPA: hypothetical protein VHQ67_05445, partial [Nitrospiraceae bacterium]|nr:hypothetical protein [Nitrospiraceae bacterium]
MSGEWWARAGYRPNDPVGERVSCPPMVRFVMFVLACSLLSCGRDATDHTATSSADTPSRTPVWVVDQRDPGRNVPPVGRSLFDYLFTRELNGRKLYDVPFPFTA